MTITRDLGVVGAGAGAGVVGRAFVSSLSVFFVFFSSAQTRGVAAAASRVPPWARKLRLLYILVLQIQLDSALGRQPGGQVTQLRVGEAHGVPRHDSLALLAGAELDELLVDLLR